MIDFSGESASIAFWRHRAARLGSLAVLNIRYAHANLDTITARQAWRIFPSLISLLEPSDKIVLDLGCGAGRFTTDLALRTNGRAIGVDIIPQLLRIAPLHANVEYRLMQEGAIPLDDCSVDIIFCCLVLGGITDRKVLGETIMEIDRVLRRGGLLFIVENTSNMPSVPHWIFRSVREYQRLFDFINLRHLRNYCELDERISILAGRKLPASI
jgi:ubiquinone/menaquinone biosynthesis C-methylase UbiE